MYARHLDWHLGCKRDKKPTSRPQIDWSHPMAKNLVCAFVPYDMSEGAEFDLTGNHRWDWTGQGDELKKTYTDKGVCISRDNKDGSDHHLIFEPPIPNQNCDDGHSFAMLFRPTTNDAYSHDLAGDYEEDDLTLFLYPTGSTGYMRHLYNDRWDHKIVDNNLEGNDNPWIHIFLTHDLSGGRHSINRLEFSSHTGQDYQEITRSTDVDEITKWGVFFEGKDRGRKPPGDLAYFFSWKETYHTVAQMKDFLDNPYQFLIY